MTMAVQAPTVLQNIARDVRARLSERQALRSSASLREEAFKARNPFEFAKAFAANGPHVIAEVKFKSPSEGVLMKGTEAGGIAATEVAGAYLQNGASALSVLTEQDHFGGSLYNLRSIREKFPEAFLLMKDFVIDKEQLFEARLNGADAVLLIVSLLGEDRTKELLCLCRELGLSALVEVHDEFEIDIAERIGAMMIGVNNRDLKTLKVSLDVSRRLAARAPKRALLVSESGLSTARQLDELSALGYSAFLIGSSFMKSQVPGKALGELKARLL